MYAIYVRTESGDEYLTALDRNNMSTTDMIMYLSREFGDEFPYIGVLMIESIDGKCVFDYSEIWKAIEGSINGNII